MPYICLARSDVPEGTVQVLDLQPNSSQGVPAYTPGGQTRYVNRVQNETSMVRPNGTLDEDQIDGLSAYLLDRVEPGGLETASSTLTMTSPHNGDTVDIAGVTFTAVENAATGFIQMAGPQNGDTVTVKTVVFTCVENFATGTATMAATHDGDTIAIKGVTFTCKENFATGTAQINGVTEVGGDTFTIAGITFTAKNAGPLGMQEFLDAQAPNSDLTSADSLRSQAMGYFVANNINLLAALDPPGGDTVRFSVKAPAARGLAGEATLISTNNATITLSGANLVCPPVVAASQEFLGQLQTAGGLNTEIATSLAATINDAASQALLVAAIIPPGGATCAAATGGTAVVTMTADLRGLQGQFALVENTVGVRILVSGANMIATVPDPAAQEFAGLLQAVGGNNDSVATSLALTINDATPVTGSQALLAAVAPLGVVCSAVTSAPLANTVYLTAGSLGLQGEFALAESTATVRMTVSGAAMGATVPLAGSQEFAGVLQAIGGTNAAVATTLRTTLTHPASIILMKAANPGIGDDGAYVGAAPPVGAVLTLQPLNLVAGIPTVLVGTVGSLECVTGNAATIVPDALTLASGVLSRIHQLWSATQMGTTSAALIARVDAGLNLQLADINTVLLANCGGELTAAGGTTSTGVVREILSILAGRGYRAKRLNAAGAANQYMAAASPLSQWNATQRGAFTEAVLVYGTGMIDGEIKPVNIGGDTENREVSGIRQTVDTDSFQISLTSGALARLCAGIDLWTRNSGVPFFPWTFQSTLTFPEVENVRVLTVYSDTGVVLA